MTIPRRVGQSAPYVVVVGDKTIVTASTKAREAGGRVGVVTAAVSCKSFHGAWSLTIGQRVTIDKNGRCLPCQQ